MEEHLNSTNNRNFSVGLSGNVQRMNIHKCAIFSVPLLLQAFGTLRLRVQEHWTSKNERVFRVWNLKQIKLFEKGKRRNSISWLQTRRELLQLRISTTGKSLTVGDENFFHRGWFTPHTGVLVCQDGLRTHFKTVSTVKEPREVLNKPLKQTDKNCVCQIGTPRCSTQKVNQTNSPSQLQNLTATYASQCGQNLGHLHDQ